MPTANIVQLQDPETGATQYPVTTPTAIPGLSTVATSGSYNDLSNKPTIPAAQVNADWNAVSGVAQILNKPSIPEGNKQIGLYSTSVSVGLNSITAEIAPHLDLSTTNGLLIFSQYADNIAPNVQESISGGSRFVYRLDIEKEHTPLMAKLEERTGERFSIYVQIMTSIAIEGVWSLYGPYDDRMNYICCSHSTSVDNSFTTGSETFFEYRKNLNKLTKPEGPMYTYTGLFGITILQNGMILID